MTSAINSLNHFTRDFSQNFKQKKVILSFGEFLEKVKENPRAYIRNSAKYIKNTYDFFGRNDNENHMGLRGFKLFNLTKDNCGPIIGGEQSQLNFYNFVSNFVQQDNSNKLILLHGPNGSSKSSTINLLANAMQQYSHSDEGAVYRFNWIFPAERGKSPKLKGDSSPIGFGELTEGDDYGSEQSYAHFAEDKIACRLHSEYKENPLYLLPLPFRENWLKKVIAEHEGIPEAEVRLPSHILREGLSKRNQLIFENILAHSKGNISDVFKYIQIERFFFSKQYRVGISTVEPRMAVDATENLLTMDKNLNYLPSILQNIRITEAHGEIVDANRGFIEYSDLFKRPPDSYKYLLSTVETNFLSLPSSTTAIDIVFIGTSNDKHLDAFKTIPDFSSFRERFHLVSVPYLLRYKEEERIYQTDYNTLKSQLDICPHTIDVLCKWAILTRLKQPNSELYTSEEKPLIARLSPAAKLKVYQGENPYPTFTRNECKTLQKLKNKIFLETQGMVVYEGRFGASPREVRSILYKAASHCKNQLLTPMDIFKELDVLVKDKTLYEFLQFEPRNGYHDAIGFIREIKREFAGDFEKEAIDSMTLVDEVHYEELLRRYITHVVAEIKNEKIYDERTRTYESASQTLMDDIEKICNVGSPKKAHRESLINRLASWNPESDDSKPDLPEIFSDISDKIKGHYYEKKNKLIRENFQNMLSMVEDDNANLSDKQLILAESTFNTLAEKYGYSKEAAIQCLKFCLKRQSEK